MDVKIRFNTDYSADKSPYKWRIIIDDVQHLVDEVEMKLPTYTTGDLVQNQNGTGMIMKWHISCKAKNVSFKTKKNLKIAVVL
jgi:hypothetical protein